MLGKRHMRGRFFSTLDDAAWLSREPGVQNIFWPALRDLPREHAIALAVLPIHDANGLLLEAVAGGARWPDEGWACVFAADPFRTPQDMLGRLKRCGVARVCCFTASSIFGDIVAEALNQFGMAAEAEAELARCAVDLGLEFDRLDLTDISIVDDAVSG